MLYYLQALWPWEGQLSLRISLCVQRKKNDDLPCLVVEMMYAKPPGTKKLKKAVIILQGFCTRKLKIFNNNLKNNSPTFFISQLSSFYIHDHHYPQELSKQTRNLGSSLFSSFLWLPQLINHQVPPSLLTILVIASSYIPAPTQAYPSFHLVQQSSTTGNFTPGHNWQCLNTFLVVKQGSCYPL